MPTHIYTKKRFMEFLEGLTDEDVILLTDEKFGASYHKKVNAQKVSFAYAADVFVRKDTVGHFFKLPTWSFVVCQRKDISEGGLKIYDSIETEESEETT